MTFVSVTQATSCLGIDAKTLHRWLAEAQLVLQSHPHDGRKKGLSREDLEVLARLHQRRLTGLPEVAPAPHLDQLPTLPSALLALPEQLAALQNQLVALQQQVAQLSHLLREQAPEAVSPASREKPARTKRRSSAPACSARPVNPPTRPTHVIPRVESGPEGRYVVICPKHGRLAFEPESPQWFAWLATQSSFRFVGKQGHFTAHHRVKYGAWRAHRHLRNHSYNLRLAPTQELTIAVLEQAAEALQAHLK